MIRPVAHPASLVLALWLCACSTSAPGQITPIGDAGVSDGGADAGTDAGAATPVCELSVSPGSLDFGQVTPGAWATPQTITLTSIGTGDCLVQGLNLGAGSDAFTLLDGPVESQLLSPLNDGPYPSTLLVPITFMPLALVDYVGSLAFQVGDPSGPSHPMQVTLTGTGSVAGRSCFLFPNADAFSFGTVGVSNGQYCAHGKRALDAINDCTSPVTVEAITFVPSDTAFILTTPSSLPLVVAPGSVGQFVIGFNGDAAPGDYSATLLIQTDVQAAPFSLTFWGSVATPATQTDTFTGQLVLEANQFPLSGNATASSLALTLNGEPLPTVDWSYDSLRNVVVVSAAVDFQLSDVLSISYWLTCN